jgi:hypothetical protein
MKYLKFIGLAAIAAIALMAFAGAGTASATEICTMNTFPCPAGSQISTLELSKDPNTSPVFETTEGSIQGTCTGITASGAVTQGDATHTAVVPQVTLGFTGCTNTTVVNNAAACEYEFHGISGSVNATVTTRGCTFSVNLGVNCYYGGGGGITLGTLVGGTTKTLTVNTVIEKIDGSSFLCPQTTRWTASYMVTNHSAVYFHV